MIRWLVIALVVANVIFFALMQLGGMPGSDSWQAPPQAALNPDKIKLLNTPVAPSAAATASAAAVAPAPHAASGVPAVAPAETAAQPPATPAAAAVSAPQHAPAVPAPAVTATATPAVTPAAPKPVIAAAPAATTAAHPAEEKCLEWGEFSGTDLARSGKALAELKLGDKLGRRTVEYEHGYLVYLGPFKTATGHNKKVHELKAAGVTDYFVIKESGRLKNAISLGVFKTEEAAKHYRAELGKKGLKGIQVGERVAKLKFTVYTFNRVGKATHEQLGAWLKDYPGSELNTLSCQNGAK